MYFARLLDNLINNEKMTLVSACQDAYEKVFENLHSWFIRKAAGLLMLAVGSKESMMALWGVQSPEEARPCLENFVSLKEVLSKLLLSKGLFKKEVNSTLEI